jgi:LmbE family N-acetylglucosaminyl deacetylase
MTTRSEAATLRGRAVLAVFAHPDDESLACGGMLARLADAGARVVLMCASRGERGSLRGPARDDELGDVRAAEMREAARALGVSELLLLDHPDGDLHWAHVAELHADIVLTIRHHEPAAVVTFGEDGLYWHADHIAVHERTLTAVRSLGANAPPLYFVTMRPGVVRSIVDAAASRGWAPPPKGFWSIVPEAFGLHAEPPTFVVDVGDWTGRKLAAMRCHRTQMGAVDGPLGHLDARAVRDWLGIEQFQRAPSDWPSDPVLESLGI